MLTESKAPLPNRPPRTSRSAPPRRLNTGVTGSAAEALDNTQANEEHEEKEFEYQILADPLMRMEYIRLTSHLVDKLVANKIDTVIFIDKSARPVSWLIGELWPMLASDHDPDPNSATVPPKPARQFLNIDRQRWIDKTGSVEDDTGRGVQVNSSTVGQDIADLRAAFSKKRQDIERRGGEFDDDRKARLDNQRIMVVDEVRTSGNTLEIARQFLTKAFPHSQVFAEYWMRPKIITDKGGTRFTAENPIWYKEDTALGRGIGDLSEAGNEQSEHPRLRRGNKFFSRPLDKPDKDSLTLRREIKQLTKEVASGQLPLRLNLTDIDDETLQQRCAFMEKVNRLSVRQLTDLLNKANGDSRKFRKLYKETQKRD